MRDKIDELIQRISVRPRWPRLEPHLSGDEIAQRRKELREKFKNLPTEEVELECGNGLREWLAVTINVHDSESVKWVMRSQVFVLAVLYLDVLANVCVKDERTHEEHDCVETIVDLLLFAQSQQEQRFPVVQEIIAAAFLLSCVFQGFNAEYLAGQIQKGLPDDLIETSELCQWLLTNRDVGAGEIAKEARRLHLHGSELAVAKVSSRATRRRE